VEILRSREPQKQSDSGEKPDFAGIILGETAAWTILLRSSFNLRAPSKSARRTSRNMRGSLQAVRGVIALTEPQCAKKAVFRVVMDEAALDVPVTICDSHLRQVFLNLIINSVDAMTTGGEFRIRRESDEGGLVVLSVEDTGPEFRRRTPQRFLIPFTQTKEQGTGLGLSIVERILDLHGGSIALAPEQGKPASRFILKLPKAT
jgi:signal transduction histidine kinase